MASLPDIGKPLTGRGDRVQPRALTHQASDRELLVEDLENLVRVTPIVLTSHLNAVARASEQSTRIRQLAARVLALTER